MKCLEYGPLYSEWLLLFFRCDAPHPAPTLPQQMADTSGMKIKGFAADGRDRNTDAVFRTEPWSWPTTVCDQSWRGSKSVDP